jgi:hypothetical protein
MNNLDSNKYISLKTAAGLYGYTRDHLGLMIRQGKLNGIKLGSYYVTTGQWMAEYVKSFAALNHPTLKNKLSNKFLTGALSSSKISHKEKVKKYDADNSLKEIIMEELTRYTNPSNLSSPSGAPYIILPIRKMENAEREEVLRKVS